MAIKMCLPFIVCFAIFSWISADENTHFKVIYDGNPAILNCKFSEYAATIKIVTVHFNSTVCNNSDEDILKEVSNLCHNKVKCEFELADLIKDHNSTCSSGESTAQLGITYHCSYPFAMQYLEGDRAMLTCAGEYNETIQISSVLYNYSRCSHGDKYGIQNLCDGHKACSFDVTNSNVGSSCGSAGKASLQVSYNCTRNGGWSNWTKNSPCTLSCGGGKQLHTRTCTNPSPNEIGMSCVGESYYEEVCNGANCVYLGTACTNTGLNWTCPGGYLQVQDAIWQTVKSVECQKIEYVFEKHDVTIHMKNKCDNNTFCDFTVNGSSLVESCGIECTGLDYVYKCVKVPWSGWELWSNCSGSCVTGIQTRTRSCNSGFHAVECEGLSTETRDCNEEDCSHCGDQKLYNRPNGSLQLKTDSSNGTGYLLLDPVHTVHCCGQIAMWHYEPVKTGNITFSVWRKIDVNRYKVVGANRVVVKGTDVNNQTTYNVPDNERILINTGDIIGWHDGGDNIIQYYHCLPSMKPCPTTTLRNSMNSTNFGEGINVDSLPEQSSRIYTLSYTSTVKGPPQFGMTPGSVTMGYRKSVNSRVMDVQITNFGDFIHKIELDYDNEYFYFDTRLRSILVKKMLPPGQKITRHNYVMSVQDWCYNTATLNITVTQNIAPMIHGLPDTLRFNPININPNLTAFSVDDPSDNVTCMINKTSPHTDMFILSLHGNDASLILSEKSKIDVNSTSEYVIKISCTDGIDTTFFDLTLLFTTNDPTFTEKPDSQSDSTSIIIGVSIGGLFLILIVMVAMVTTTNQYSRLEGVDAITGGRFGILKVELLWGSLQQAAIGQQTSNKFQLILNVAVGGGFFPDSFHYDRNRPWNNDHHQYKTFGNLVMNGFLLGTVKMLPWLLIMSR